MIPSETLNAGSLIVCRKALPEDLISDAVGECEDIFGRHWANYISTKSTLSPGAVNTTGAYDTAQLRNNNYDAILKLRKLALGEERAYRALVVANRQMPYAMQRFHPDNKIEPVAVLHLSDGGSLDYIEDEDTVLPASDSPDGEQLDDKIFEDDHETVNFDAGDLVHIARGTLIHRGRNRTNKTRYTLGMFTTEAI